MTPRKICVVTGSRAEYGLLRRLMQEIRARPDLVLQLVVTGMHLSAEFGSTAGEIAADGFAIDARVDMALSDDTAQGITRAVGRGVIGFSDTLHALGPDLMVILGDRFEILAAAQAAMLAQVPIAHLHGGELTEGAIDESIRHAVTKMAHLHFAAAEPYRSRIIRMGEAPERVFAFGAPGVDNVRKLDPIPREALAAELGLDLRPPLLLVTYHPETLGDVEPAEGVRQLLDALDAVPQSRVVLTGPNADAGGRGIAAAMRDFVRTQPRRAVFVSSLGQHRYLSLLRIADAVVGNSSSGLIEAPAAGVPTVNIGDRQKGRLRSDSVIDCAGDAAGIAAAIRRAMSDDFRRIAAAAAPAYGAGDVARRICDVLAEFPLAKLKRKAFYDAA